MFKSVIFVFFLLGLTSCSGVQYDTEVEIYTGDEVFDFTLRISNGTKEITPRIFFNSSYQAEGTESLFSDYLGLYFVDFVKYLKHIPAIEQTETMTLTLSDTITGHGVEIYDSEANLIEEWDSWDHRSRLDPGQYFIVVSFHNQLGYEYVNADGLFALYVS